MSRNFEKGIPALYKYQNVKYSHFEVSPGASYVLTADPWSFLQTWLIQQIPKRKSKKKECLSRALYYSKLAEDFYKASNNTVFPVKGTLAYYAMLNLVKCYLSTEEIELETSIEHHGLTLPIGQKKKIKVTNQNNGISIFAELCKLLQKPISSSLEISISDIIAHIPELHEMAYSLNALRWSRRKYLPVEIDFLVNESKNKVFTEIRYEKKNETRVDTSHFYKNVRKNYFVKRGEKNGWVIYRSRKRKSFNQNNFPIIYRNIQSEYSKFNLCSILTRNGYRYYCDLKPGHFHHLGNSLALMFYLGSIARYRPTDIDDLKEDKLSPIMNEALVILPHQFVYQLVSIITKSICAVPQSKIN